MYRYVSNSNISRLPNVWAVLKALHLHTQTSCFYSLFLLATSVWRNGSSRGSTLRERRCGALPVQHPGQSRPGRQGKSSHMFISKWMSSFSSLPKMYFLAFTPPSAGARNPTALRCVAWLFSSSPGSLPGRLPCGRKEPGGWESAADCVCSGLCGHRGVPGGAPGQCGGLWQGDEHFSKWMQDYFWHNTNFCQTLNLARHQVLRACFRTATQPSIWPYEGVRSKWSAASSDTTATWTSKTDMATRRCTLPARTETYPSSWQSAAPMPALICPTRWVQPIPIKRNVLLA